MSIFPSALVSLEERLVHTLVEGVALGEPEAPDQQSRWAAICGDVSGRVIACELPPLLGRLYRTEHGRSRLIACGLLPEAGSRALFWQALAVRIASCMVPGRRNPDGSIGAAAPENALENAPENAGEHVGEDIGGLHEELMKLLDAARSWERERERLREKNERLEAVLEGLRAATATALGSILENRPDAIRGLARLAETSGLPTQANNLRRLPRLPFSPVATPVSPGRRPGAGAEPFSLMPSHQMANPRDAILQGAPV